MTAPEFSYDDMRALLQTLELRARRWELTAKEDERDEDERQFAREGSVISAIAARLTATSADWQPPPEAERPDGFMCLGFWSRRWVVVEWTDVGHAETKMGWWSYPYGHSVITPTAFARLPPTLTTERTA